MNLRNVLRQRALSAGASLLLVALLAAVQPVLGQGAPGGPGGPGGQIGQQLNSASIDITGQIFLRTTDANGVIETDHIEFDFTVRIPIRCAGDWHVWIEGLSTSIEACPCLGNFDNFEGEDTYTYTGSGSFHRDVAAGDAVDPVGYLIYAQLWDEYNDVLSCDTVVIWGG